LGEELAINILMLGGKKGGLDLDMARGDQGAFDCVVVSVRVND